MKVYLCYRCGVQTNHYDKTIMKAVCALPCDKAFNLVYKGPKGDVVFLRRNSLPKFYESSTGERLSHTKVYVDYEKIGTRLPNGEIVPC